MSRRGFGIPPSKDRDPSVERLRELMEIGTGQRRNQQSSRWVTFGDLVDSDIGRLGAGGGLRPGAAVDPQTPTSVGPLSNLQAIGAFQNIILQWEGTDQSGYAYTEIWRHDEDNLANATMVQTSVAPVANHVPPDDRKWYFWVRGVSTTDNPGPFNDSAGTPAQTVPDYEHVRDVITATEWQPNTTYSLYNSVVPTTDVVVDGTKIRLVAIQAGTSGGTEPNWNSLSAVGQTIVDGAVAWMAVEAGKIPFFIDPGTGLVVIDGAALRKASIDSAKIGSLAADKIFAASGTIASALIGSADITNAMVKNLNASKLYASFGTIAQAIIGSGHINNAMIGDTIQSDNFSDYYEQGWRILKNGDARFYGIVLTRPNLVASGTWSNPQTSGYEFETNQEATPKTIRVKTNYQNNDEIYNVDSAGLTAKAIVSLISINRDYSDLPTSRLFNMITDVKIETEIDYYRDGLSGPPSGDIYLQISYRPIWNGSAPYGYIRIDKIDWALMRIT